MATIPDGPGGLTRDWVAAALESTQPGASGGLVAVAREQLVAGAGLIADLHRLTLTWDTPAPAGPRTLMAKLPAARAESRALAAEFGLYAREVMFYREVAPAGAVRVPRPWFAAFDPTSGNFAILMEDLAPARAMDPVTGISVAEAAAVLDTLAAFQACWFDHADLPSLAAAIPPWTAPPYEREAAIYAELWPVARRFFAARGLDLLERTGLAFGPRIGALQAALSAGPRSLCHGDLRPDNLMVLPGAAGPAVALVDWQSANQGHPAADVGHLIGNHMAPDLRRAHQDALLRRYHDGLLAGGVTGYGFADVLLDTRRGALFGLAYLVDSIGVHDPANTRQVLLLETWSRRLAAAIADLDLAGVL